MLGSFLLAVLVDRPAISLRNPITTTQLEVAISSVPIEIAYLWRKLIFSQVPNSSHGLSAFLTGVVSPSSCYFVSNLHHV